MYNMAFTDEEMVGSVSVFHTKLDMFITGVWPKRFAERILRMWERGGRDISYCELRKRELNTPDNTAILIVNEDNHVVAFFHWENKGYAHAYTDPLYKFIKYTPPEGKDINDIYEQFSISKWDGKGKETTLN
ncbi:hypothetical protein LCGC14_0543720 [marine sediment metagenome]|uniref:Uncharacterized protein n=1 Tax=marine sediment metagenome TaxID=412755 RepID=A0A0F9V0C2_9ZZZZ